MIINMATLRILEVTLDKCNVKGENLLHSKLCTEMERFL